MLPEVVTRIKPDGRDDNDIRLFDAFLPIEYNVGLNGVP